MTWILILLCLAIAGRELYMAFDRGLPEAQTEIRDLRRRVAGLQERLDAVERPGGYAGPGQFDEPGQPGEYGEPDESRRPDETDEVGDRLVAGPLARAERPEPSRRPATRTTAAAAVSAALIRRLERDLGETTARLADLEHELATAREAAAARARSLDAVEQTVGTLYREMIERLEHEPGTTRGLLYAEEPAIEHLLAAAYERCVGEHGMRVRAKEPVPGSPWWTGYLLGGDPPDDIAVSLLGQARALRNPDDPSGLCALLTELARSTGAGVARIGGFTAVRTQTTLICGILADEPGGSDPAQLATRLADLPATTRWEPAHFPRTPDPAH